VICEVEWEHPDACALREARRAEIAEAYGRDGTEPVGSEATGSDMAVFLVAYREGAPVACGGLRALGGHAAEIKRMYAAPSVRGTGVATEVLRALETWASAHDVGVLRLETGDVLRAAQRFYEREGYVSVPPFGPYAGSALSRCYERRLRGGHVREPQRQDR
jgi:GNAT superfamily N-acetyltransferase